MIGLLKKRLANKILIAIIGAIILIMGAEIVVRIYFGTRDRIELINFSAKELAGSTYAGMKYPMAVGDAEAIIEQLKDIRETAKDVQVFICDYDQKIVIPRKTTSSVPDLPMSSATEPRGKSWRRFYRAAPRSMKCLKTRWREPGTLSIFTRS